MWTSWLAQDSLPECSSIVRTEPRRVREYRMEFKSSEPGEGENNNYSHTPDGHERAELSSAAVAGSGSELRPVPACLNGACASGRARPRNGFAAPAPAPVTATPSGTTASRVSFAADGSMQQPGVSGAAADAQSCHTQH